MTEPAWRPLLSGRAAEPYTRIIDEIVVAIDRHEVADIDWGHPLLHTYLGEARSSAAHRARGAELVDRATAAIEHHLHSPALYGGSAGVAWLSAHTDRFFDREAGEAYADIEDALMTLVEKPEPMLYDLIGGLVGIGVYFVERLPHNGASDALNRILQALAMRAEDTDNGTTWWTPPDLLLDSEREMTPQGFYNLGVAHGVPGIVGLLGEMCQAKVGGAAAEALLRRAARWVLSQRIAGGFPSWVTVDAEPVKARVAWCYGGLGVSVTLLSAARALGDVSLEAHAIDVALECAATREDAGARDAGLCHGSSGIAHLFNRLFQATDRAEFGEAACFWLDRALEMRVAGDGVAGYRPFKPAITRRSYRSHPCETTSFLTGASGIALAFLAATSSVPPNWDRALLTRLPPIGVTSAQGMLTGEESRVP